MSALIGVSACLDLAALVAAAAGEWRQAALLFGASSRRNDELGAIREAYEGGQRDRRETGTRAALGDRAYDAERARGHDLTLEDAVACAFSVAGDSLD